MNLSFAISFQQTKFDAVSSDNFEDTISFMRSLGFNGVELALRNPEMIELSDLESELNRCKLNLIAIGTGQAYVDEGISLTDFNQEVRREAIRRIKKHMDLASNFNSQVIIGLIRGKIFELTAKEQQIGFLERGICELCDYAEKKKVLLTIEPLNRYECNILNTAEDVINLIKKIKSPFLKLLLDTFHMNIEEGNISKTIIDSRAYLTHVHIADSNRKFPGMGHINFIEIHSALKDIEYNKFLSGEMLPFPNLQTAMKCYITAMKEVMNE